MIRLPKGKRVLVFCAHPDDETFGMGASIAEMARNRCKVSCLFLTTSPRAVLGKGTDQEKAGIRIEEAGKACRILGAEPVFMDFRKEELEEPDALERISEFARKLSPDEIFSLPGNDVHPTHRKASWITHKVAEDLGFKGIWLYESWTLIREPNCFHFFGDREMKVKQKAMREYRSQLERQGPTDEAFACLNRFRSVMSREPVRGFGKKHPLPGKYAEAFQLTELPK